MASARDSALMARALRLAARGLYTTDPNPRVGCVVTQGEEVVGEGWHVAAGEPHAEVLALRAAGARARGATAYVTLEPCCHHGRTPPCTAALIDAGIARVVGALRDPDPRVAGQGFAALEAAGVAVERMDGAGAQARALNIGYVKRMTTGRPWIRIKLAMSVDGRTALASGASRWITGEAARTDVHRWRARSSCILTGRATLAADDPSLDVRLSPEDLGIDRPVRQPGVAVVDTGLNTSPQARVFDTHAGVLLLTAQPRAHGAEALKRRGAEIVGLPAGGGVVDPGALFAELGRRGMNEVHVEAGPTLCGGLLASGYVDELLIYMAPHVLGDTGRGLFSIPALASMDERVPLHIADVRHVGPDLRLRALPMIERE